jgi:predicted nucleic acid-binding protein
VNRTTAFWDSSALIPLCVHEQTSNKVKRLAKQLAPVVWWATTVEIHSAIARLHRSGALDDGGRHRTAADGEGARKVQFTRQPTGTGN